MKYSFGFDFYDSLISAFDIGGSLPRKKFPSNGLEHDMKNLIRDLKVLENDYRNVNEKLGKEISGNKL